MQIVLSRKVKAWIKCIYNNFDSQLNLTINEHAGITFLKDPFKLYGVWWLLWFSMKWIDWNNYSELEFNYKSIESYHGYIAPILPNRIPYNTPCGQYCFQWIVLMVCLNLNSINCFLIIDTTIDHFNCLQLIRCQNPVSVG